jgi:hypothetical protein
MYYFVSLCPVDVSKKLAANVQGLWSGGGFETRLPERLPI